MQVDKAQHNDACHYAYASPYSSLQFALNYMAQWRRSAVAGKRTCTPPRVILCQATYKYNLRDGRNIVSARLSIPACVCACAFKWAIGWHSEMPFYCQMARLIHRFVKCLLGSQPECWPHAFRPSFFISHAITKCIQWNSFQNRLASPATICASFRRKEDEIN